MMVDDRNRTMVGSFVLLLACLSPEFVSGLTIDPRPLNTAAYVGSSIRLHCGLDDGSHQLVWSQRKKNSRNYQRLFTDGVPSAVAAHNPTYARYSAERHHPLSAHPGGKQFDLLITDVESEDARQYACEDSGSDVRAVANIIVIEAPPTCVTSDDEINIGDVIRLSTQILYNGAFDPDVTFTSPLGVFDLQRNTEQSPPTGVARRSADVTATAPLNGGILTAEWSLSRAKSREDENEATNVPVFPTPDNCTFGPFHVWYPVANISIHNQQETYNLGDVITCGAHGNPDPSFQWITVDRSSPYLPNYWRQFFDGDPDVDISQYMDHTPDWMRLEAPPSGDTITVTESMLNRSHNLSHVCIACNGYLGETFCGAASFTISAEEKDNTYSHMLSTTPRSADVGGASADGNSPMSSSDVGVTRDRSDHSGQSSIVDQEFTRIKDFITMSGILDFNEVVTSRTTGQNLTPQSKEKVTGGIIDQRLTSESHGTTTGRNVSEWHGVATNRNIDQKWTSLIEGMVTTLTSPPEGMVTTLTSPPAGMVTTLTSPPEGIVTTLTSPPEGMVTTPTSPPEGMVTTPTSPPEGMVTTSTSPPEGMVTTLTSSPTGMVTTLSSLPRHNSETQKSASYSEEIVTSGVIDNIPTSQASDLVTSDIADQTRSNSADGAVTTGSIMTPPLDEINASESANAKITSYSDDTVTNWSEETKVTFHPHETGGFVNAKLTSEATELVSSNIMHQTLNYAYSKELATTAAKHNQLVSESTEIITSETMRWKRTSHLDETDTSEIISHVTTSSGPKIINLESSIKEVTTPDFLHSSEYDIYASHDSQGGEDHFPSTPPSATALVTSSSETVDSEGHTIFDNGVSLSLEPSQTENYYNADLTIPPKISNPVQIEELTPWSTEISITSDSPAESDEHYEEQITEGTIQMKYTYDSAVSSVGSPSSPQTDTRGAGDNRASSARVHFTTMGTRTEEETGTGLMGHLLSTSQPRDTKPDNQLRDVTIGLGVLCFLLLVTSSVFLALWCKGVECRPPSKVGIHGDAA